MGPVRCLGHGWVVAEVGCWSLEIASVYVRRGHGEIGVGHGDGFGGDRRGPPHGWLVLLGSAFPMVFFFFFNMDFCSDGIFMGSGGVVGMVEVWWW